MGTIDVHCPECDMILMIDEDDLGGEVKCPKCKHVFEAEDSGDGGDYQVAEDPTPKAKPRPRRPSAPPKLKPETEAERKLRERMEKWAEGME